MKKHVIALAVSAAAAMPAFAQNVSVYGVYGMSYDQAEISGVSQSSSSSRDPLNSSRFGIKGTEDLGGGMKASFTLEGDLNPQDGSGDSTGLGLTFDRAAFIELDTGAGVQIQAGRFANATKRIDSAAAAGTNLMDLGYFLFSTDTIGSIGLTGKMGSVSFWAQHSNDVSAGSAMGSAAANTVNQTAITAQSGLSETGAGLGVVLGGIDFKIARTERGGGTETVGTASGTFAGATLTALAARSETAQAAAAAIRGKSGNVQLGVVYPVSGLNVRASIGRVSHDTTTNESKYMGVMLEKPLSKRTSVYVGYSDKDVNNGQTGDITVSTAGITHSF
jgi:predicted porin